MVGSEVEIAVRKPELLRWRGRPSTVYSLTGKMISMQDNDAQLKITWDIFAIFKATIISA